jgi:hypothetical protein
MVPPRSNDHVHREGDMALALTPKRLMPLAISNPVRMGVSGKVKDVLSSVPLEEVDSIRIPRERITSVERAASDLGKTVGRDFLRLRYVTDAGTPDSAALVDERSADVGSGARRLTSRFVSC